MTQKVNKKQGITDKEIGLLNAIRIPQTLRKEQKIQQENNSPTDIINRIIKQSI